MQIVAGVALGAIAHAELDPEVDAQADKEHGKGDRYQIQRAEHDEAECRRDDQSDAEAQQDRGDQTPGAKRDPQQQRYCNQHDRSVERGALGERRELLVGERYRTGLTYPNARIGIESKLVSGLANRRASTFARLQCAVVEDRLHEDEPTQLARLRSPPADQRAPRKSPWQTRRDAVEGVRERREGLRQLVYPGRLGLHAFDEERERVHQTAHAGIRGKAAEQRLRRDQRLRRLRELRSRFEQQACTIEERSAVGAPYGTEEPAPGRQSLRQCGGRLLGELRRRSVDDDRDQVRALRKRHIEDHLALAPGDVLGDQPGAVRIDRDVTRGIGERAGTERRADDDYEPGMARASRHDSHDHGGQASIPAEVMG